MQNAEEKEQTLAERAENKIDVRAELDNLERQLSELKVLYEQYFVGLLPLIPDKQHTEVKSQIRRLRKAPFRNSALNFKLRTLEGRYQTFNNYWQRILKQKEEGTYSRDVFKAELHQQIATEQALSGTEQAEAQKGVQALFNAYKNALEKQAGAVANLDYASFKDSLVKRAKLLKEKHGVDKLTFTIAVKDGKVLVKAKAK